jgi:hypothetical protein
VTCLAATLQLRAIVAAACLCSSDDEEPVMPTCADDRTLRVARGAHAVIRLTFWDEDDARFDLTDHEIRFRVAASLGGAVELTRTVGDGIELLTQSGDTIGQADLTLTPAETSSLAVGLHVYEVRITTPSPASIVHSAIEPSDLVVEAEV